MSSLKTYLPIFLSTFISLAAIMALVALVKPEFFSLVPGTVPKAVVVADSTKADSTAAKVKEPVHLAEEHKDSLETSVSSNVPDSTKGIKEMLTESGVKLPEGPAATPDTLSETEKRKMAQIFESMDAESAAKILNNMDDEAVRQVIAIMKRRQSAKILASLSPQQAARLLKGKIE